jgi:ADP-ribose pyrophosphatase
MKPALIKPTSTVEAPRRLPNRGTRGMRIYAPRYRTTVSAQAKRSGVRAARREGSPMGGDVSTGESFAGGMPLFYRETGRSGEPARRHGRRCGMRSMWRLISSTRKFSDRLISVDHDRYELEGNGRAVDFTIVRTCDWINVIPVTEEGRFVFIRQFRHGIRDVTLEIPGGAIDARDRGHRDAAERELREETGYAARDWEYLGYVTPNPALQDNRCHTYLASRAYEAGAPAFDPYERIEVELLSRERARQVLRDRTVHHGLVLAAFGLYFAAGYDLP